MRIRFKKFHPEAKMPTRATNGAAGWDLYTVDEAGIRDDGKMLNYRTGLGVEIPKGYVGLIFPRSSIYKTELTLANCVGVIDSDYRGEIRFMFRAIDAFNEEAKVYLEDDRIGQLVLTKYEEMEFEEVDNLEETARGENGFGSSGR